MTDDVTPTLAAPRTVSRGFGADRPTTLLLLGLGLVALLFMAVRFRWSLSIVPMNYNEGWNAYHALRFLETGSPYPPRGTAVFNNYPPLWFVLVGELGRLTDSMIAAARIVATSGLVLLLVCSALIGRSLRGNIGALAALSAVAYILATQGALYIGIADPQFVGQGIGALALLLCVRANSPNDSVYLWAVAVAVSAGYFKHNLAALPLALVIAAALYSFRAFLRVGLAATAALIIGYLVSSLFGGFSWPVNLISPRVFSMGLLVNAGAAFLSANVMGVFLAGVGVSTVQRRHIRNVLVLYIAISMPLATFFSGGQGVASNVYFDSLFAIAIAASLVATMSRETRDFFQASNVPHGFPRWLGTLALTVWLGTAGLTHLRDTVYEVMHPKSIAEEEALFRANIEYLRSVPGNALCQELALCFRAGKALVYDPFNADQATRVGTLTPQQIMQQVGDSLAVIQVVGVPPYFYKLPLVIADDAEQYYFVSRTDRDGAFFRRRGM